MCLMTLTFDLAINMTRTNRQTTYPLLRLTDRQTECDA